MTQRIILTGFMGTGKTTVGRLVAAKMGLPFVDLDEAICHRVGQNITEIFAQKGEAAFREIESQVLREILSQNEVVLATGGGTLLSDDNRKLCEQSGTVVCLTCDLEVLQRRLNDKEVAYRPLLTNDDPKRTLVELWERRREVYRKIFWQVDTSGKSPQQIADTIIGLVSASIVDLSYPDGVCKILVGRRLFSLLDILLNSFGLSNTVRIAVISNHTIAALHGEPLIAELRRFGYTPYLIAIPDGEEYKNLETVADLYDRLLEAHIDRGDLVIALGGGVIGDIVGFVASTYMRGLPLIQIPTSLLAMVDASIGGKTGLDLPKGKNLIGTFKRPLAVLVDPEYLDTLPRSEFLSGMAEVIKHAVIADPLLFSWLERGPQGFWMDENLLLRAVAVKVNVVQADPYENGLRAILNFGHTIGHALETLSGYTIRHGEAVSVGMAVESKLAEQLGILSSMEAERIIDLINRWTLPVYHPLLEDGDRILSVIRYDKKHRQGKLRWALPYQIGKVDLVSGVDDRLIKQAISSHREAVHAG